jgi:hypothetical protein
VAVTWKLSPGGRLSSTLPSVDWISPPVAAGEMAAKCTRTANGSAPPMMPSL